METKLTETNIYDIADEVLPLYHMMKAAKENSETKIELDSLDVEIYHLNGKVADLRNKINFLFRQTKLMKTKQN